MDVSDLIEAVKAVDRAWELSTNAYDITRIHLHPDFIDALREMRRQLRDTEVANLLLRDLLTPEWPAGGYFCLVCEKNAVGNLREKAWSNSRDTIEHVQGCALKGSYG